MYKKILMPVDVFEMDLNIKENFNKIVLSWLKNTKMLNLDIYTLSWITFFFSIIFIIKYS